MEAIVKTKYTLQINLYICKSYRSKLILFLSQGTVAMENKRAITLTFLLPLYDSFIKLPYIHWHEHYTYEPKKEENKIKREKNLAVIK